MEMTMKKRFVMLSLIGLWLLSVSTGYSGGLSADLAEVVSSSQTDDLIKVWIKLHRVQSAPQLKAAVAERAATRAERHEVAIRKLREDHARSQAELVQRLREFESDDKALNIKTYWITNLVEADVAAGELPDLATRDDIEMIYTVPKIELIAPESSKAVPYVSSAADSVTSNLEYVRADSAWALGYTGAGRLICTFDTGVDGLHPALFDSWKGHDGDSAAAWFDPAYGESFPHVASEIRPEHGTWTLGAVCGRDDTRDFTIGVAPDAQWMSAAIIDIIGTSILDAFQWVADPDGNPNTVDDLPDVVNHSWGFQKSVVTCENLFYDVIRNVEALGVVNIFAAGNSGAPSSIYNPANGAEDSLDCFAVGNLNTTTTPPTLYYSSSLGPSDCNPAIIKPNVVAPGIDIVSAWPGGDYHAWGGTSIAAPHVSGLVALLRQKNPNATVDEIKEAILAGTQSEVSWGVLPNNNYGWGAIDCVAALEHLDPVNTKPHVRVFDFTHLPIAPGDTVTGTVVLQNLGSGVTDVSGDLIGTHPSLEVLSGSLYFGDIAEGDTVRSTGTIQVVVSDTVTEGTLSSLDFRVYNGMGFADTLQLGFLVDPLSRIAPAVHSTGSIDFTITNYGALNVGDGFRFEDGLNDLFDGGLILGTGPARVSSRVHSIIDNPDDDFWPAPGVNLEFVSPGPAAEQQTISTFSDYNAADPIGLLIRQESFSYSPPDDGFVILRYILSNPTAADISGVYFGIFFDWDIVDYPDNAGGYDDTDEFAWMAYNSNIAGNPILSDFRGVKMLQGTLAGVETEQAFDIIYTRFNGGDGYLADEKYASLTAGFGTADTYKSAKTDLFQVMSAGPMDFAPGGLDTVTFAVLAGSTFVDIQDAAARSLLVPTPVGESPHGDGELLPASFALYQNYPNPFNPSTTISFDLPRASDYRLCIYNMLGQRVHQQGGKARAGRVDIVWDAGSYASGVYLYEVAAGDHVASRKMLLLK
jgi:bacillopeptidase F